jgi:hypothetical protein
MQKVNIAHKNRNLLQLVELRLAVEQIDQNAIGSINEDRLNDFNKILQRQSLEPKQEIEEVELHMKTAVGLDPFESLTPKKLMSATRKHKKTTGTCDFWSPERFQAFQEYSQGQALAENLRTILRNTRRTSLRIF